MKKVKSYDWAKLPFPILFVLPVLAVLWGMPACERRQPIKVGFVGGLTGRLSDLGISGRNGVMLAVEEINGAGGINGRAVELITKDDKQDPKVAVEVDRELIREGVVAIIGHMTSSMSMAALPVINREKIVMISPTTSTNRLTGRDDYFIRMTPPNRSEIDHLAGHAFKQMGLKRVCAVYDLSNRVYTEGYCLNFRTAFERMGGKIIRAETFTSGGQSSFSILTDLLLGPCPEGLLIAAGALDTAMICQYLRMAGSKIYVISSGWAMTGDFLEHGGQAVEGVIFSQLMDRESRHKSYVAFKARFRKRFSNNPNFAAAHGYEAARVLFKALSLNDDPRDLKKTILEQAAFEGLQGDFSIDPYGDPKRNRFLTTVQKGRFRRID